MRRVRAYRKRVVNAALLFMGASHALASPFCPPDFNNDDRLNFFDISAFIDAYLDEDPAADFNSDGDFDFFDISNYIQSYLTGCPDLTDSDNDRIPDFAETNDGRFIDLMHAGTDPLNPDTDNDGISDGDELLGTIDNLDLPAMGANPLRRTIFVECDWFAGNFDGFETSYRPTDEVIAPIVDAFKHAPVPNPYDAPPGIDVFFDHGQGGAFTNGNQLPGAPLFIFFDFEFNILKDEHFEDNRNGYFHYAIFGFAYNDPENRSSGVAELPGDDFMVTLADYGTPQIMTNTIMHELGHNLNLKHGGDESLNWKPNYNSVMNYRYQFDGVDITLDAIGDGLPDYSLGVSIPLDETRVIESLGIDGNTPIDWDDDGEIRTDAYAANLNCRIGIGPCGDNSSVCWDDICEPLRDHDDWNAILWSRFETNVDRLPEPRLIECASPAWLDD
tara:strand:- start:176479 stop:177813 length:1335 start_codon:yes stop_codon:yes gene_type:complete